MPDFSQRSHSPEIMDDLEYSGEMMDRTLHELEVINRLLGGNEVTINALDTMVRNNKNEAPYLVSDLGCGRGDMLRLIERWARKKDIDVRLSGVDANAYIIKAASVNLKEHPGIELLAMNILSQEFQKRQFDIVIGTLFYHHFTNEELIRFFSNIRSQVRIGLIINDIHRHPLAYYAIKLLTKFFSASSMVKFDAPLSVLRAFKKSELVYILKMSGFTNFHIRWRWAFRWQVLVAANTNDPDPG
jgi:2-polyprenyl-3-methyl-5-hydroxy-6-metoxy-1,4-benzoquinol methylase